MTEREKVIKGPEHCIGDNCYGDKWSECKYSGHGCIDALLEDALALLKVQEPVEPVFDAGDGKTIGQFLCGKCHAKIGFGHPHFCWYCGQEVKWE